VNSSPQTALWTAVFNYFATGEGQTIAGWIGYASSEEECRRKFGEALDPFYARGADCVLGVARNEITTLLWSTEALDMIEAAEGRGTAAAISTLHFNFS
jgi:hypothetical protein